jgi:peptidyl-prolyl cis-trans isomerase C
MTLIPRRMRRAFLLPVFAISFLAACAQSSKPVTVATVGGEAIDADAFSVALSERLDDYGADVLKDPEGLKVVKKTVLDGLIQERVLLQAAKEKGVSLTPEEAKAVDDGIHAAYGPGELEKILKEKNLSLEEWRQRQIHKRLIDKLIRKEVTAGIQPSDEEVADYYKKNKPLYRLPDRIRCRHIVTSKRDKAERIRSLLDKGENFASVAQKYSESPDRENGGDLGYIARGEYPEIFEKACFSLGTGQTSDVIASEYGFHIFRVTDKQPTRQQTLPEVASEIGRTLQEQKTGPKLKEWMDGLYRNKKITIDEKALKGVSVTLPNAETLP